VSENTINVNGVEYVRADSIPAVQSGDIADLGVRIVVLQRG
jgi:hypothetical protein